MTVLQGIATPFVLKYAIAIATDDTAGGSMVSNLHSTQCPSSDYHLVKLLTLPSMHLITFFVHRVQTVQM